MREFRSRRPRGSARTPRCSRSLRAAREDRGGRRPLRRRGPQHRLGHVNAALAEDRDRLSRRDAQAPKGGGDTERSGMQIGIGEHNVIAHRGRALGVSRRDAREERRNRVVALVRSLGPQKRRVPALVLLGAHSPLPRTLAAPATGTPSTAGKDLPVSRPQRGVSVFACGHSTEINGGPRAPAADAIPRQTATPCWARRCHRIRISICGISGGGGRRRARRARAGPARRGPGQP